jgi:hypothetical protein
LCRTVCVRKMEMDFEKENTTMAKTYTAEQTRLYDQALAELAELPLPNPDDVQRAADAWLNGLVEGKPVPLDLYTRWALGAFEEEEEFGIQEREVPKHIAEAFAIRTYGDLISFGGDADPEEAEREVERIRASMPLRCFISSKLWPSFASRFICMDLNK